MREGLHLAGQSGGAGRTPVHRLVGSCDMAFVPLCPYCTDYMSFETTFDGKRIHRCPDCRHVTLDTCRCDGCTHEAAFPTKTRSEQLAAQQWSGWDIRQGTCNGVKLAQRLAESGDAPSIQDARTMLLCMYPGSKIVNQRGLVWERRR